MEFHSLALSKRAKAMSGPIFILAGEPSGDQLAANLMRAVNNSHNSPDWIGVGGPLMIAEGLKPVAAMDPLTIIGFGKSILSYRALARYADTLVNKVETYRPRFVLTVDAKGFSIRFAQRLRRRMTNASWSVPIVHCVAPTVWAWGGWRTKKYVRALDGLLCLFPFEPQYFKSLGLNVSFIGHPDAFDVPTRRLTNKSSCEARKILLLPGSRREEIKMILPEMLRATQKLLQMRLKLNFYIPTLPQLKTKVMGMVDGYDVEVVDSKVELSNYLESADAMMATSGTITLQAALYGVPGVTCYRTDNVTAFIGKILVNRDNVILPNVILGRKVYPFLFQKQLTADALASSIVDIINNPDARGDANSAALDLRLALTGGKDDFEILVNNALEKWL